ncbi:Crp/Fnr family transcriptional regulator [Flavobacterium sp.]|uniref:Crp/Fnr family transcriptional regulator n=1 Tax=Flavobacterium sp. TaxID=239 RepID=UPI0026178DA8|nr:Crp/Fnr family transcriptional regulator [Flavobacterium sp.]
MTNSVFIDYLQQFNSLNQQQIELINSHLICNQYKEGEYFLEAGKISDQVGFIVDGVFRVCYYSNKGNEITRYFLHEINFIVDLNSYNKGIPSSEYIQSVTDSSVVILRKKSMEELSKTIIGWDALLSKITAISLSEKVARVSLMIPQDAAERYDFFLESFPKIANRVPLQYIASYIGVTKSSLSRLRRVNVKKRASK